AVLRPEPPGARTRLRERPSASFGLEHLAALECSACRIREMTRELEIVVGEHPLLGEQHGYQAARLVTGALDRHCEQGPVAARRSRLTPCRGKPLVVDERRRRDDPAL